MADPYPFSRTCLSCAAHKVNLVYANYNRQSGVELAQYSFLNIRGDNVFISDKPSARPAAQGEPDELEHAPGEPDVRTLRHAAGAAGALDVRRR